MINFQAPIFNELMSQLKILTLIIDCKLKILAHR